MDRIAAMAWQQLRAWQWQRAAWGARAVLPVGAALGALLGLPLRWAWAWALGERALLALALGAAAAALAAARVLRCRPPSRQSALALADGVLGLKDRVQLAEAWHRLAQRSAWVDAALAEAAPHLAQARWPAPGAVPQALHPTAPQRAPGRAAALWLAAAALLLLASWVTPRTYPAAASLGTDATVRPAPAASSAVPGLVAASAAAALRHPAAAPGADPPAPGGALSAQASAASAEAARAQSAAPGGGAAGASSPPAPAPAAASPPALGAPQSAGPGAAGPGSPLGGQPGRGSAGASTSPSPAGGLQAGQAPPGTAVEAAAPRTPRNDALAPPRDGAGPPEREVLASRDARAGDRHGQPGDTRSAQRGQGQGSGNGGSPGQNNARGDDVGLKTGRGDASLLLARPVHDLLTAQASRGRVNSRLEPGLAPSSPQALGAATGPVAPAAGDLDRRSQGRPSAAERALLQAVYARPAVPADAAPEGTP